MLPTSASTAKCYPPSCSATHLRQHCKVLPLSSRCYPPQPALQGPPPPCGFRISGAGRAEGGGTHRTLSLSSPFTLPHDGVRGVRCHVGQERAHPTRRGVVPSHDWVWLREVGRGAVEGFVTCSLVLARTVRTAPLLFLHARHPPPPALQGPPITCIYVVRQLRKNGGYVPPPPALRVQDFGLRA